MWPSSWAPPWALTSASAPSCPCARALSELPCHLHHHSTNAQPAVRLTGYGALCRPLTDTAPPERPALLRTAQFTRRGAERIIIPIRLPHRSLLRNGCPITELIPPRSLQPYHLHRSPHSHHLPRFNIPVRPPPLSCLFSELPSLRQGSFEFHRESAHSRRAELEA